MADGLALVLGRWLDRPGWGSVRRLVGSYLAEVRAEATEPAPPSLRLETPSGKLLETVAYVEGETVWECARRTHPETRDIILCGADLTPLDPVGAVGAAKVLVVVVQKNVYDVWNHARNNKLGILRWAIAHGLRWQIETSYIAAEFGHLELLQWAIAHGCGWHPDTSCYAAMKGHLSLLQWAVANGCLWHPATSWYAAKEGHLELLRWAVANGCPWHTSTSWYAATGGHLELLVWALANGCPLDKDTREAAVGKGHTEIVEWLDGRA